MKGQCSENYKMLIKDIEDDTKKWKDIPFSWIGRPNIVKMCILPKVIYTFNEIPIKITPTFFTELKQTILKICVEPENTPNSQSNLEKENQSRRHNNPRLQAILQSVIIKTLWY